MTDVNDFARLLLEESKRFLEKAAECDEDDVEQQAELHAALLLAFCSLDANINVIASDFFRREEFSAHDRSVMFECEVRLEKGEFINDYKKLKMWRLIDRIQFLHKRLSGKEIDKTASWWPELNNAIDLRNELTHPKKVPTIRLDNVQRAVDAIIGAVNVLYAVIYKVELPFANRGLRSNLTF